MKSINFLKPKAHLRKNAFDLSFREIFSAKAGQLLPVMCKELVPGDHFEISLSSLTRTQPLNTAAFLRCKEYFHFYFVPFQSLWHQWDSFISQRDNRESAYIKGSKYVPNFGVDDIHSMLGSKDFLGYSSVNDGVRLLRLLGYGNFDNCLYYDRSSLFYKFVPDSREGRFSLLPILAYNKIYYDYYCNPFFEKVNPAYFNADDIECDSVATSALKISSTRDDPRWGILQMRYRNWKKDRFTSVLPNAQFGDVSFAPIAVNNGDRLLKSGVSVPSSGGGSKGQYVSVDGSSAGGDAVNLKLDVLELRKAEAIQRWKETTLRAGYKHNDQAMAHFGVTPRHYMDNHSDFIGGFDNYISVSEVISTANGSSGAGDSALGQLAGKGLGAQSTDRISYDATEFGYLFCIYSVVPEADYNDDFVDKKVTRFEPFDFFTPEFENLGLEPIFLSNMLDLSMLESSGYKSDEVIGYNARYIDYKTSVDLVDGNFRHDKSLSAWVAPRNNAIYRRDAKLLHFGGPNSLLRPYELLRPSLKIDPSVLDSVFSVNASVVYKDIYNLDDDDPDFVFYYLPEETDQFMVNCNFDIRSLRPMSVSGLPVL